MVNGAAEQKWAPGVCVGQQGLWQGPPQEELRPRAAEKLLRRQTSGQWDHDVSPGCVGRPSGGAPSSGGIVWGAGRGRRALAWQPHGSRGTQGRRLAALVGQGGDTAGLPSPLQNHGRILRPSPRWTFWWS